VTWTTNVFSSVFYFRLLASVFYDDWLGSEILYERIGSESESELLYYWRFTVNQFVLAISPLRLTTSNFIFQLNTCSYSLYVASSLTRGWVYRLQLLLVLATAAILRSKSRRAHNYILLSQIRDSPNLESQVPVFISPPEHGGPVLYIYIYIYICIFQSYFLKILTFLGLRISRCSLVFISEIDLRLYNLHKWTNK
jgi:hypothetical protein